MHGHLSVKLFWSTHPNQTHSTDPNTQNTSLLSIFTETLAHNRHSRVSDRNPKTANSGL